MPPRQLQSILIAGVLILVLATVALLWRSPEQPEGTPNQQRIAQGEYFFCFWNVENLFDDQKNLKALRPDEKYDTLYSSNPELLNTKLSHLSKALLAMNGGRGPDVLCVAEVESTRAAELLKDALNRGLTDPSLQYKHVLMEEVSVGRHIAPAIITRLPVVGNRTRRLGKRSDRIVEGHVKVNGQDLVVIASHWTSRKEGAEKTERRRDEYADAIYGEFKAMYLSNSDVDVLVCGDFNDTPHDISVTDHLHATADVRSVLKGGRDPMMYDLMAGKEPSAGWGTHYYEGKWLIFDQIVVSPGMLNPAGWSCDPETLQVINTLTKPGDKHHRPWRFDERGHEHGYSDHFPVTVKLKVQAGAAGMQARSRRAPVLSSQIPSLPLSGRPLWP